MGTDSYRTIDQSGTSDLRVRGSRFLGFVEYARSVPAAQDVIETLESEYPDATHVVPAYRIRNEPMSEYASDDGEPSGSAGDPMLTVLRGEELQNIVAVVVRYYGGTNLGIGGLVRAYQGAIKQAIENATVILQRPQTRLLIESAYDDSGTVRSILDGSESVYAGSYEEIVTFRVDIPTDLVDELEDRLRNATSDRVSIKRV